jgi:hypothetical protein
VYEALSYLCMGADATTHSHAAACVCVVALV